MEKRLDSKILTKMYRERGVKFGNRVNDWILERENKLHNKLEGKLQKKYNKDEVVELLDIVSELCCLDCETYYKIGFADGIKLERKVKEIYEKEKF